MLNKVNTSRLPDGILSDPFVTSVVLQNCLSVGEDTRHDALLEGGTVVSP